MKSFISKKTCLFRITATDREKLQKLLFKRYPHHEWGSFFRFGYRVTPWGIHVSFVDAIEPQPGDLKRDSGIVEFDARYILRAQLALADTELGIGVIHSHPEDCARLQVLLTMTWTLTSLVSLLPTAMVARM
jgi:hypothetical protein